MGKRNHTTSGLVTLGPLLSALSLAAFLLSAEAVWAQTGLPDDRPDESEQALPAIIHVGIPLAPKTTVALAGTAGYGYIEPVYDLSGPGHRAVGRFALAASPVPYLILGADVLGRLDDFSAAGDSAPNLYGEPRLTARYQRPATENLHYGLELDVRLVGAAAPNVDPAATSPSLRGLFGARLADTTWLAAELGFHWDNSHEALGNPAAVVAQDRVTVSASSFSSIPWGVGVSHRLAVRTELLGELSGDILLGSGAPAPWQSPLRASLGARHPLMDFLLAQLTVDVGIGGRPEFDADTLALIEPRVGANLSLIARFGSTKKTKSALAAKEKEPESEPAQQDPEPPAVPTSSVKGMIIDEGGRPLADVEIVLKQEGAPDRHERTYADGGFEFKDVPEGPAQVVVKTPGYDQVKLEFGAGEKREKEVILYPSLPAGQVKGEVRDLRGNPLPETKITVSPGDAAVEVSTEGKFTLELAPGRYTVKFEHPDLSPQKRVIRVQERGVVILNIALTP